MKNLEDAKKFFRNDLFAVEAAGIEIVDTHEKYAKCAMKILPVHKNAAGAVMGGAIFTLADFTFAVAANELDALTVTAVSQISFLGTAKGDTLYGETRLIKDGKRNGYYEISVTDDLGNLVAVASTCGSHLG